MSACEYGSGFDLLDASCSELRFTLKAHTETHDVDCAFSQDISGDDVAGKLARHFNLSWPDYLLV